MKKLFLLLIVGMFFLSFVNAQIQDLGTFKQNQNITLVQICGSCTFNKITSVLFPNASVAVSNISMLRDGTFYNSTFTNTTSLGTYIVNGVGDLAGTDAIWSYTLQVTPTGKEITTGNSILTFLAVLLFLTLGSLSIIGMATQNKRPIKWTLGLLSFIFFLSAINLISVIIPDALINETVVTFFDTFTAASFYLFWFAFGLLIVIWIITTLQTLLFDKIQKNMEKFE